MKVLKLPTHYIDLYQSTVLPILQDIAIYYRQSTEAQIGNISTLLQTVDMVEHLKKLGWQQERIKMIDLDGGVSGTKGIRERPGMSLLFDLIENEQIGAVAAQDVDRFFRETAQIETNIFIDACCRHHVLILTPTYIYDFSHPIQGPFHIQLFRRQIQRAADHLEFYIKGKMQRASNYYGERGQYIGRTVPPGFMVDMRTHLPDGTINPHYRKYVIFQPWADVTLAYFGLFRINNGSIGKTLRMIRADGVGFPEVTQGMLPSGFIEKAFRISTFSGSGPMFPTVRTLTNMLTNVVYLGHWVHKNVIARWNNHEAIIPLDLFMYAYNRLSPTDFQGEPNPNHAPYLQWLQARENGRTDDQPTYRNLVFSNDLTQNLHAKVHSTWRKKGSYYGYILKTIDRKNFWDIQAYTVDQGVDTLLRDHLKEMIASNAEFDHDIVSPVTDNITKSQQLRTAIRGGKQTKTDLLSILTSYTNPEIIRYIQTSYENVDHQIGRLIVELDALQAEIRTSSKRIDTRKQAELGIANWQNIDNQQKRMLFERVAIDILLSKINEQAMHIEVRWRDGLSSCLDIPRGVRRYRNTQKQTDKICEMIDANKDQVEILRAFPKIAWRSIKRRYVHWTGAARWPQTYTGKIKYREHIHWADTEEAKS